MPNLKNRVTSQIMSYINRVIKFEICEVDKIHWHRTKKDHDYNVSDVVIRDRRTLVDPLLNYIRKRIPALQLPSGKFSGHPTNPRRGNLIKVLFYKIRKGLVLNQISSKNEPPVCRPDPYTERTKYCQYRPLYQDTNKDFPLPFPDHQKPTCFNWEHGPCFGDERDDKKEPCLGRDWWQVYDFCQEGDEDASCENCVDIDYCKRCKNTWLKVYSANTMSCQAPNRRVELHNYCGSYFRFENETGRSSEYSEGCGHIRLENATCEASKKGHLNFNPHGSIDIHSVHEEVEIVTESHGTRVVVVAPEDVSVDYAVEAKNFETGTYIRIMKNGDIEMYSPGTIHMKADEKIVEEAPLIEQKTLLVYNHGDEEIDGFCTHAGCSCSGTGGTSGWDTTTDGWDADTSGWV